jgi:hypothetical protein
MFIQILFFEYDLHQIGAFVAPPCGSGASPKLAQYLLSQWRSEIGPPVCGYGGRAGGAVTIR